MTPTPIRNTEARKFWCERYKAYSQNLEKNPYPQVRMKWADNDLDEYAARFGDAQLIEDIAANKARRANI